LTMDSSHSGRGAESITADISIPPAIQRIVKSDDRCLAWHFFVFFSRMEYALKRTRRYLRNVHKAEPNWDRFGSDHDQHFRESLSTRSAEALRYFEANPPRKQIQIEGTMGWSEPSVRTATEKVLPWLLLAIRTVRNNLFHGGKFPLIPMQDPSRDRDLLVRSLTVLNSALELDAEVKSRFFEGLDD
ncbi:MAG: hypothetical protein LC114_26375, partial [Bryobacterales bacterium]|nr:hypothetical protein [Bryobacterales bacterium]